MTVRAATRTVSPAVLLVLLPGVLVSQVSAEACEQARRRSDLVIERGSRGSPFSELPGSDSTYKVFLRYVVDTAGRIESKTVTAYGGPSDSIRARARLVLTISQWAADESAERKPREAFRGCTVRYIGTRVLLLSEIESILRPLGR